MKKLMKGVRERMRGLGDPTAWLLLALSLVLLWQTSDYASVVTVVQWSVQVFALLAIAIMLSRIAMPWINVREWIDQAREGSMTGVAMTAVVVMLLLGILVCLVLFSRP